MKRTRTYEEIGWMRLESRLSGKQLKHLTELVPQGRTGRRLNSLIGEYVPDTFRDELYSLGYSTIIQRAVAFSKTQGSNWSLPWHQDRVVTMTERTEDPTISNWSKKDGLWHCEPSVERLQSMAFLYIAIDPTRDGRGGLEIAQGTHRLGKIPADQTQSIVAKSTQVVPLLKAGETLLIKALTIHRSAIMRAGTVRRAIRFDLCYN